MWCMPPVGEGVQGSGLGLILRALVRVCEALGEGVEVVAGGLVVHERSSGYLCVSRD